MKTVTGTLNAYMTEYSGLTAEDISNPSRETLSALSYSDQEMGGMGWIKVGRASIEIEFLSDEALRVGAVKSLREQQSKIRAEAERKATDLERQIQTLLAITHAAAETV